MKLDKKRTLRIIRSALKEDIGIGDATTINTVGKLEIAKAAIVSNEDCIICGMDIAEWTVNALDENVRFKPQVNDGEPVHPGKEIAFLEGRARSILSAERTALNFLCFLSGIATKANDFAKKTKNYKAKIYDTRKTFPLLRYLEKYAVLTGGGYNHRFGLWDQALVKENHFKAGKLGARPNFIKNLRGKLTKNIKIEVEVENLDQFRKVLAGRPDIIMLDNMTAEDAREAVSIRDKAERWEKTILEASGGITIENVEEYAKTGVDRISIGALTDSVESADMSLKIL